MTAQLPVATADGLHPRVAHGIDKLLSIQRPVVLAHIRAIRRSRPGATPDELCRILERRYLTAVTSGGALVGASAAIPAVGVGTSLVLSGAETAGFLEASALFAQSITEIHGIPVVDPDRARTLVMTMILGNGGQELLAQFATQAAGRGTSRNVYWGELITRNLPGPAVGILADKVKHAFVRRFAVTQGSSIVGRAIPFGIGAVIGGTGNHLLGRAVVRSARSAFGPAPAEFPASLDEPDATPRPRGNLAKITQRLPRTPDLGGIRRALTRSKGARAAAQLEPGHAEETLPPPDPATRRAD
ncbi:hypothetical protein [uncultured Schumannella sp.]|uniref:hypothetical protein n=1 Tax=uncultured Schumannella sp. TaxID=1195956 RepID=UPI0025FCA22F|nr:hypothetical protein [uncultured Schumannella sp.]